jgi:DNA repair protein RecO
MSYHIYTTNGIILKRTPFGEANLLLHILTEDLGLIMASAQSARLSVSKLRSALQEYTLVSVSCIKGKNGWKTTNVLEKDNFYFTYPEYTHRTLAQVVSVLMQMMPGEDPQSTIFNTVKTGFRFLKSIQKENISNMECLLVLRILYHLGYVFADPMTERYVSNTTEWSEELLGEVAKQKIETVAVINKAIKASQL